jgi:hypothetical protein
MPDEHVKSNGNGALETTTTVVKVPERWNIQGITYTSLDGSEADMIVNVVATNANWEQLVKILNKQIPVLCRPKMKGLTGAQTVKFSVNQCSLIEGLTPEERKEARIKSNIEKVAALNKELDMNLTDEMIAAIAKAKL